jgi:predicted RNA binding protein YcfA (HicA-like mRNA interferase family)
MSKLPLLKAVELAKILKKLGFELIRQEGSHMFFRHMDGRTTVVPNHPGEHIDRGLLTKIIKKDLELEREDFIRILRKK